MKSSTPACAAIAAAVKGLSPVTITVRRPIRRSRANRSAIPGLRMSSRTTIPAIRLPSLTNSGVAPFDATSATVLSAEAGTVPFCLLDMAEDRVRRSFANLLTVRQVDAAHPRLSRERNKPRSGWNRGIAIGAPCVLSSGTVA